MKTIETKIFGVVTIMTHSEFLSLPVKHELYTACGFNSRKEAEKYSNDFWFDCDHIKSEGEKGRGNGMFTDIKVQSGSRYIITKDELNSKQDTILEQWLNAVETIDLENTWMEWDKVKEGVAYRGGQGYFYTLDAYSLCNN